MRRANSASRNASPGAVLGRPGSCRSAAREFELGILAGDHCSLLGNVLFAPAEGTV